VSGAATPPPPVEDSEQQYITGSRCGATSGLTSLPTAAHPQFGAQNGLICCGHICHVYLIFNFQHFLVSVRISTAAPSNSTLPPDSVQHITPFQYCFPFTLLGRDSSVGIATCYRLDGPGIESRWRRGFPHPSSLDLGPTQPRAHKHRVSFPRVKRIGRAADHPTLSGADVKEKSRAIHLLPSAFSWQVVRRKFG
jgi:hypothetical protein